MKKLMIALAVMSAVGMAQAAKFSWGFGGKVWLEDGNGGSVAAYNATSKALDPAAAKFTGTSIALFYLGDNVSSVDLSKIDTFKQVDSMSFGVQASGTNKGKWDPGSKEFTIGTDYAHEGASFAVLFNNGEEWGLAQSVNTSTGAVGADIAANPLVLTADQAAGLAQISSQFLTGGSSVAGAIGVAAVPEPTSGLLLLLGVAGLALRRRRA